MQDKGPFDFVSINGIGLDYPAYFDWAINNLDVRGVIAAHNPFQKDAGKDAWEDGHSELMRLFNQGFMGNSQFTTSIFPVGDGTLIAVKYDLRNIIEQKQFHLSMSK